LPLTGSPLIKQTCCRRGRDAHLACLPHIFIAGAPKAASTALHAWLLLHPQVRPPARKEAHYFDDTENFARFVRGKFNDFHPRSEAETRVNIDSTPGYLEHVMGCQRLARYAPATSRFAFILRHPVQRFWSYFVMERRRVYVSRLRLAEQFSTEDLDVFVDCLNKPLCNHVNLSTTDVAARHSTQLLLAYVRRAIALHGTEKDFWASSSKANCFITKGNLGKCLAPGKQLGDFVPLSFAHDRELVEAEVNAELDRWRAALASPSMRAARAECNACAAHAPRKPHAPRALDACVGCRCRCRAELAKSPLRHSLYRAQLEHCFEHVDRSRFLLLDYAAVAGEDMRLAAQQLAQHAGLAAFDFSRFTDADANARFDASHSRFKQSTAWAADSVPAWFANLTMPADLQARLREFFGEDTEYLRTLTGLALKDW